MRTFDKDQLSDAIFELVRSTAKEFVAERRKSSGCYSTAQKRCKYFVDFINDRSAILPQKSISNFGKGKDPTRERIKPLGGTK